MGSVCRYIKNARAQFPEDHYRKLGSAILKETAFGYRQAINDYAESRKLDRMRQSLLFLENLFLSRDASFADVDYRDIDSGPRSQHHFSGKRKPRDKRAETEIDGKPPLRTSSWTDEGINIEPDVFDRRLRDSFLKRLAMLLEAGVQAVRIGGREYRFPSAGLSIEEACNLLEALDIGPDELRLICIEYQNVQIRTFAQYLTQYAERFYKKSTNNDVITRVIARLSSYINDDGVSLHEARSTPITNVLRSLFAEIE